MENLSLTPSALAPYIQHTKIQADATRHEMERHINEAVEHGFNAAMVSGSWVPLAHSILRGTKVTVASALDFPTVGVMTSIGKAAEAAELVRQGAAEIDIGVQIGWLKSGMYKEFESDIAGVVNAAGVPIKVMLELPLLTEKEREIAVELSISAGASYLKNASSGQVETANPTSIRYLVERAKGGAKVKASGSIKSLAQAQELIAAGADLLGTSAGIEIISNSTTERTKSY